jgi:capsular polysaccharide biosynthesis protein
MGTDVSLLTTREVAARTVRELGNPITPEALQATITAEPVTGEILVVTVAAPDNGSALARTRELTRQYLGFRAAQLRSLSNGLIAGYHKRITEMQEQASTASRQYDALVKAGRTNATRANDLLTRRATLEAQISDLQQAIESASLTTEAAISSTHVVDQPQVLLQSPRRQMVLAAGSGLIIGTALGVGLVLFRALTSDRVRRRHDVALALGAPVRGSVASRGPAHPRPVGPRSRRRRRTGWRGRDLEALVHILGRAAVPGPDAAANRQAPAGSSAGGPGHGMALAAIGNAVPAASVLAALATHLRDVGLTVFLVDLSASGSLVATDAKSGASLDVFRPSGVPGLAQGPRAEAAGTVVPLRLADTWHERWDGADVVLALAEVDPGIDAENLATWVTQVVPVVTAGLSRTELLETTGELVRAAGMSLPFALMLGADHHDQSAGLTGDGRTDPAETEVERTASMGQG